MDQLVETLKGALPAALVAFFFLAIAWKIWEPGEKQGPWGTALALPLGFFASFLVLQDGRFPYPPSRGVDWALWLGFAAGVVGLIESPKKSWPQLRYTFYVLLAVALAWVLPAARSGGSCERWGWTLGSFVYVLLALLATQGSAEEDEGPWLSLSWAVVSGALAFVCIQGASVPLGQLMAALAAMLAVAAFVGGVHKRFSLKRSGVAPLVVLFSAMLLNIHFAIELDERVMAAAAATPFLFWLLSLQSKLLRVLTWILGAAALAASVLLLS
ncbi:MAG: hypothetical protein CSA62_07895 [Planctomycetota bacterium]|nr:MAG: hypothetical protein CSA62_07895 [Planctomycetota bacterium]